jgi:glutamine---fructose-6-phosphate transaminase (isomerizing)
MCGIVAYKGVNKCLPILFDGLKKLEYRGYDSAGVAYVSGTQLITFKSVGCVNTLYNYLEYETETYAGIGHTRWATHGHPSVRNAHPHTSLDGKISLVHNGIIENYETLKKELLEKKYYFLSDTDSEVLMYLVYDYYVHENCSLFESVKLALERVVGAYAIAVLDKDQNLVLARNGSPLVIGVDNTGYYASSDTGVLADYTNKVIYVADKNIVGIGQSLETWDMTNKTVSECNVSKLDHQVYSIEKGDYENFMLKEIEEQPKVINDGLRGRLDGYRIKLGGLSDHTDRLMGAQNIIIIACGSSYYAGLLGKYYFEEFCGIKTVVEHASEFKSRKQILSDKDIVIAISQSGETADTINAIELAKSKGSFIVGVCNSVNSSFSRLTDCGIYCRAGVEVGVASTKAFSAQILSLLMMSLWIDQHKHFTIPEYRNYIIDDLRNLADGVGETLGLYKDIRGLAARLFKSKSFLYLGREYNYPCALEGALKLKEISYIHAEGYPAGEMKHGPLALVDNKTPVWIATNNNKQYPKLINSIKEIQARHGKVLEITSRDDSAADYRIKVPKIIDPLSPFISVVVYQLFSYYCALLKGYDVDKPRNLAKSVTVE